MNTENSKYPFFDIAAVNLIGGLLVKPKEPVVERRVENKKELRFDMTEYFGVLLDGKGNITGDR